MPITDFVLRSACSQLREWQLSDASFANLNMHVNVSGNDVAHPGFVARVTAALVEARLEPQHLALELTENILMERLEAALPTLAELRRLGIGLSVDDFGTGYSSLRHLSKLPVNSLKVDRAFIAELTLDSDSAAIVQSIVLLGKSLGKAIIAEGIETPEQVKQLLKMGCSMGQGYHLSRPLAAQVIDGMLAGMVARAPGAPALQRFEAPALFH
jgi:EAL domain-containing protein (putative c-di-GMP-specific phosphodiesterase class I)